MRRGLVGLSISTVLLVVSSPLRAQDVAPSPSPAPPVEVIEVPPAYRDPVVVVAPVRERAVPASAALRAELARIDAEASHYPLGGPIVITVLGGLATGIAATVWLLYAVAGSFSGDYADERYASGIATVLGVGVLVTGLAWLFTNLGDRRPLSRRRREIILQLRSMGEQALEPALAPLVRF